MPFHSRPPKGTARRPEVEEAPNSEAHSRKHSSPQKRQKKQAAMIHLLLCSAALGLVRCAPDLNQQGRFHPSQQASFLDGGLEPNEQQSALADQFLQASSQQPRSPFMQLRKLSSTGNNITCNDGSPVGYYERLNSHSKSWVIYLQGGGFCGGQDSCQQRWTRSPQLMSSKYWPKLKTVDGILSNEPKDNPYLWNANHIYVPYCSSDSWSGFAPADASGPQPAPFAFMGSKILERVLESLYDEQPLNSSLAEARFVLLAGDSAGATGVILNLDKVAALIEQRSASSNSGQNRTRTHSAAKPPPVLRGLADSGWFLDNEPYDYGRHEINMFAEQPEHDQGVDERQLDCDRSRCTPSQSVRQAMRLWNGQVPEACAASYQEEPWKCYFGYRAYQSLRTPLFVVQWLYDEAQLMVDNIARPDTSGQWNYVNKVVNEMRASLENVTALFAPSCFSHSLITRRSWNQININGFKLPQVLNSWEEQSQLDTSAASLRPDALTELSLVDERQQVELGGILRRNNISSLSPLVVERAALESLLLMDASQPPREAGRQLPAPVNQELQRNLSQKPPSQSSNTNRPRNRKRRRNNQQQRAKQTRQRAHPPAESSSAQLEPSPINNDLSQSQNPLQDLLPLIDQSVASEQLLGRLSRELRGSNVGRLGRSTLVDDATLMLSNNMPDDNLASTQSPPSARSAERRPAAEHKPWSWPTTDSQLSRTGVFRGVTSAQASGYQHRFRLIDSCGWPQCNRDCPIMDSDFNSAGFIQF